MGWKVVKGCPNELVSALNIGLLLSDSLDTCSVDLASSFTPNRDGIHENFRPRFNCPVVEYELTVFNRWGQQLFKSENPEESWDGTYKGNDVQIGTYVILLRFRFEEQPEEEQQEIKQALTIIR
ncbi:MAG: gliding motility-associated C-terminal domain-containing protein [Salibacteraceae bacterium]